MASKMTEVEFQTLKPLLGRLTLKSVEVAEQVLVSGRDQAEVAREYKLTRQRVNDIVGRVQAAADDVPAGWVYVEGWFPPDLAAQVRQMQADAMKAEKRDD